MDKCQKSKIFEQVRNRRFQTKTQVEIMGLIVIVILLSVAMIFVLQFTISKKPPSIKTYSQAEIAENMLTAMRYTSTNCSDLTISELLKKCAAQRELGVCPGGTYCTFVEEQISDLFDQTLEQWRRPYNFTATFPPTDFVLNQFNGSCTGERRTATHILPVPGIGIMTIRLDVCD